MNTLVTDFSRTATLIEVFNPFDVSDQRREIVPLRDGVKILDMVPADKTHLAVSINGELLEREDWDVRAVLEGDYVVLCPVPAGGGGGKNVLRMVALIAIAIVAPYAAVGMGGAVMGSVGALSTIGMVTTAAITIAGSMMVNALLPIDQSLPGGQSLTNDSPSYGIDGAKNTSREGIPVPVVYGRYRVAGNLINVFTRNVNGGETQDLYSLYALSEGPVGAILTGTILVNDQPIENFSEVYTEVRLGEATQPLIDWFDDVIVPEQVGVTLSTSFHTYTTKTAIDRFRLDIVAPQGWRKIDDKGVSQSITQYMTVQYRKDGTSTWYDIKTNDNQSGSSIQFVYTHDYNGVKYSTAQTSLSLRNQTYNDGTGRLYVNQQTGTTGWKDSSSISVRKVTVGYSQSVPTFTLGAKISAKKTSPYRMSFESTSLIGGRGIYHIRVKRNTAESSDAQTIDTLAWVDLNEIQLQDVRYKYTALLGVKIRLTDQLNSGPNITVEVEGRQVRQPLNNYEVGFTWVNRTSANPAWVALDMMTSERYGAKYSDDRVDMFSLLQWAAYCDTRNLEFNGIFDADMNFWDAMTHVFRCGHAKPVPQGMKMGFAIERSDNPVMMFNVSNIKRGSFAINWLPMSDRANEIEASYYPADNNFKQASIKIVDSKAQEGTVPRVARLNLIGVTNSEQARRESQLLLNMNRYIQQTATWDAAIEAIACKVGDLVLVQHDIPKWSFGGRTEAGSSRSGIKLDREVTIEAGKNYEILLNFDHLLVSQGQVVSKINDYNLYISETVYRQTGAHRIFIGGNEYGVKSIFSAPSGFGVTTEEPMIGVAAGDSYDLFRLDALESRAVMNIPGTSSTLVLSDAMPEAPGVYVKWLFGPTEVKAKPFRILSISGSDVTERSITALEYWDEVFTDNSITSEPPIYIVTPGLQNITNLTAVQVLEIKGTTAVPIIRLEWTAPDSYRGADIFVQRGDSGSTYAGSVQDGGVVFEFTDLIVGETLTFRVAATNNVGSRVPVSKAPQVTIEVTASGSVLPPPSDVICRYSSQGIRLDFNNPEAPNYLETELFHGTVNNTGQATRVMRGAQEFFIHGLPNYGPNFYWLRSVNTDKTPSVFTAAFSPEPLAQVANLRLKSPFIGNAAEITWDAITGAVAYQVEVRTKTLLRRTQRVPANEYSYAIQDAIADGDVDRNIEFTVLAISADEKQSPSRTLAVTNPAPALPSDLSVFAGFMMVTLEFTPPSDPDYLDTVIWVGTVTNFTPSDTNQVAAIAGGPIVITNLEGKTDYYMRLTSRDAWGFGSTSAEYNVRTMDISEFTGLSPWAYVTDADRQFIEDNLENDAIPSEKIISITASRITTGTLAATEKISVEGQVESVAGSMVVTMGPKLIDSKVALFSIMNGTTPLVRFNEDGTNEYRGTIVITGGTGYANLTDRPKRLADLSAEDDLRLIDTETKAQEAFDSIDITDYADPRIANAISAGGILSVKSPGGGQVDLGSANLTGAIKITLPQSWTSTMMYFSVDVLDQAGDTSFTLQLGGYNAGSDGGGSTGSDRWQQLGTYGPNSGSASGNWLNASARLLGSINSDNTVRFGHDGSKCCIFIGEVNSTWQNAKVVVRDFQAGHSNFDLAQWSSDWAINLATVLPENIDAIISDALLDAKSIKGQGVLATEDAVEWETQVVGAGRPSSNADVTNYADKRVANAILANDILTVRAPDGGQISLPGADLPGAIKVTLPQSWTGTMMYFTMDVYNYQTDTSFTLQLGGHNAASGQWIYASARLLGSIASNNTVRFGHDGSKCCIFIGEVNSVWDNLKITIRDFQAGASNFALSQWDAGWSIGLVTTLPVNIDATITDALLDARSIKGQGVLATEDAVDWATQVTGSGRPANGATVGADWNSTLSGIPDRIKDSASVGLNLTSEYLGYYDGTAFRSYIQSDGSFHFGSSANNFIDYNGTSLVINTPNFAVDALGNASFSGNLSGSTIDAGAITTGTINVARLANIDSAQIADAAIISAKIGNLAVTAAKIKDASIGSAKLGGVLESDDYTPSGGASGWQILKSGAATFNNLSARGEISGSLITGSTIRGSVIEGTAFVAATEAGSPYVGLTSNLSWSSSLGSVANNQDRYFSYIDIASYNATPTDNYRRFRRRIVNASASLVPSRSDYNVSIRFLVYNGTTLVIDTGNRLMSAVPVSGAGWSMTKSTVAYESCTTDACAGTYCTTEYTTTGIRFNLVNYSFTGSSQLRIRFIIGSSNQYVSFSGSATATAYNDY
jgi:predicted phage tail protein